MKATLAALALLLSAAGAQEPKLAPFPAPPSSDVGRISDVVGQLERALGELPADVQRLAIYQIKSDSREFKPGEIRYLQGRIEETFARQSRRTVVNSPELKTLRVVSTDTSLVVSNSLPGIEEMVRLGERLHVDAFVDGSCTRSPEGDMLLTLRVYKARSGELAWSGSFVSGPSRGEAVFRNLEVTVSVPFQVYPVDRTTSSDGSFGDTYFMTTFAVDVALSEPVLADNRLSMGLHGGYTHLSQRGLPDSLEPPEIHLVQVGLEGEAVFFQKKDPLEGYWLGAYAGFTECVPLLQKSHFGALRAGYRSRPTRHFTLSAGATLIPYGSHVVDAGSGGRTYDLGLISYEFTFLRYTF